MDFYFKNGLAVSTQRTYNAAKKRYAQFCIVTGRRITPASEHQLCCYVAWLAMQNIAHSTIKCYLSAVRHLHIAEGLVDPKISSMARLEQVLRGVKSTQAKGLKRPRPRLPISIELLNKMRQQWQKEGGVKGDRLMLWSAASLCFFGLF